MVTIHPFKGLRPNPENYAVVPSVPYDVISLEEAAEEIAKNTKTLLRVIRPDAELPNFDPHSDEVYLHAAKVFDEMKKSGVFVRDENPSLYLYRIHLSGKVFTGLITTVPVSEYNDDTIKKHELTRYDKEEDRTRHIDSVSAHTGQVFLLYKDPENIQSHLEKLADNLQPAGEYTSPSGNLHQIFKVDDPKEIKIITELFANVANLYIADGHHRAKSSANVCERRAGEGRVTPDAEKFMGVLFAENSVTIYGYHRLVRDLAGMNADQFLGDLALRFSVNQIKNVNLAKNSIPPLAKDDGKTHIMHLYLESQWYELTRPMDPNADAIARLDVSVLQELVLDDMLGIFDPRGDPRVSFVGGVLPLSEIAGEVDRGEFSAAFIMRPVTARAVIDVADAGLIMPPKSTWFEPKLLSGMVIHEITKP